MIFATKNGKGIAETGTIYPNLQSLFKLYFFKSDSKFKE